MKKILFLLAAFVIMQTVGAAIAPSAKIKASEAMIPVGATGKQISMQELSTISVNDFEQLTGKKMGSVDKLMFKTAQKKLRHTIDKDGNIKNKKIEKLYKKHGATSGFNIGGFALGFFLFLIGVLIAYLISADDQANFRKWAWVGAAVSLVIILIFAVF